MKWENLLSLKRQGDSLKRLRSEQDETRVGFDVDYDRIVFSSFFTTCKIPLRKTLHIICKMCGFGLQMNWSKILGMEITPTFSCPLATKWKQRLRVNVKLFQEQGKIKMISAL